jgi:hypothetical protein
MPHRGIDRAAGAPERVSLCRERQVTRRALVAPCTTTVRGLASEVALEPDDDPVPRRSSINLDSVESVSVVGWLSETACERCARRSTWQSNAPTANIGLRQPIPTARATVTVWLAHSQVSPI